jgi:hypothetical protein
VPVDLSTFLVPFLCPDPRDLLGCWLRRAMHNNLDTQSKLLLCPLLAPALLTGVHPQMPEARKASASGLQQQLDPVLLGDLGAEDLYSEEQTLRIYEQVSAGVAFYLGDLLAAIVTAVFATHCGGFGRL